MREQLVVVEVNVREEEKQLIWKFRNYFNNFRKGSASRNFNFDAYFKEFSFNKVADKYLKSFLIDKNLFPQKHLLQLSNGQFKRTELVHYMNESMGVNQESLSSPLMDLSMFHTLGKILYNKFTMLTDENSYYYVPENAPFQIASFCTTNPNIIIKKLFDYKEKFQVSSSNNYKTTDFKSYKKLSSAISNVDKIKGYSNIGNYDFEYNIDYLTTMISNFQCFSEMNVKKVSFNSFSDWLMESSKTYTGYIGTIYSMYM